MSISECSLCHFPVRIFQIEESDEDGEPGLMTGVKVDPKPSLHGWIQLLNLATGEAVYADRGPGRYRPHYETCKGRV